MKFPRSYNKNRKGCSALLLAAVAGLTPLSAANYTWDINSTNNATIDAGDGTWDTNGANLVWNDAGTNVPWSQSNATSSPHNATFAGADASGNTTYTITLGASVGVGTSSAGLLRFSSNGYVITAPEAAGRTITVLRTAVDASKTATLSGNVTLVTTSTASMFTGYGTLVAKDGAKLNPPGNSNFAIGSNTRLEAGSVLTATGSMIIGGQSADGSTTTLTVAGGNVNISGSSLSLILANVNSTTGNYSNTVLTLSSGNITNNSVAGGLRFGGSAATAANNTNVNGTLNLDGGVLTVGRLHEADNIVSTNYNSTLNLNGGTLRVLSTTTNGASFLRNLNTATVRANGAIIDTNGVATTIGQALLAEMSGNVSTGGGLTKVGNGTLTLTGNNTYTGNTTVSGGTLAITAPYSAITTTTVAGGARLRINSGATPSTLPAITLQEGSGLELNLGSYNASTLGSASFASLNATGNYTLTLTGTNIPVGNYTFAAYSAKAGPGSASLGTLPPGVTATLNDTGLALVLNVLTPQVPNYIWASTSGTWDTTTSNWNLGAYTEGGVVTFPNLTGDNVITLSAPRSPFSVEFQNTGTNTYRIEGSAIAGNATLTKSGTGTVTLASANTYAGATSLNAGLVLVTADGALGSVTGNTVVASGASLGLDGGVTYSTAEPLTLSGSGYTTAVGFIAATRGAIQAVTGACTYAGPISLGAGGARFGVQNQTGASLTLSGTISPAAGVSDSSVYFRAGNIDGNYIILTGENNSWHNTASIYANPASGTSGVRLGRTNALPTTASVVAGGTFTSLGTTLDLNGFNQTFPGLVESDGYLQIANLKSGTTSVVTLNTSLADYSTVAGVNNLEAEFTTISDGAGTTALVKKGSFKQTLDGVQTYSGPTTIEAGTLAFTGTGFLQATPVTMWSGATLDVSTIGSVAAPRTEFAITGGLSGSGSLNATGKTVTVSNTFAPGALAVSGNLTLAVGTASTLVASTTVGASSLVAVTDGSLVLDGNLAINPAAGFTFASGQSFTFATGTVVAGLDSVTVSGNTLTGSGGVWTASFGGLDYTFTESTATLVVSGGVVITPLQSWRNTYFPGAGNDGTGIGANNADPDSDGINNLVEYATNTSPVAANASPVVVGTNAGRLTLTFPRIDDPSLRYTVEVRDDLVSGSWTSVTPASPATNNPTFGFTGTTPGVTESVSETVIDSVTIPAPGKRFLRLSVDFVP